MTTTTTAPPLLRLLSSLEPALRGLAEADPVFLSAAEKREALVGLRRCGELVKALELRVLGVAALGDDVREEGAYRTVTDLHAFSTLSDRRTVAREVRLAEALEQRWHQLATALRTGGCSVAQAEVIVAALERLPEDLPAGLVEKAEAHLVEECVRLGPRELRVHGRRLLDYLAPDVADAEEARQLDAEEKRAREQLALRVRRNVHGVAGKSRVTFDGPDAVVDRLITYLDAYTSPRHQGATRDPAGEARSAPSVVAGDARPMARKRGQAFVSLLESLDPRRLPIHGGDATSLIVTISYQDLVTDLGTAAVLGGDRVTAAEARRLACTANILPMVLGGDSEVLDLGRARRLFSRAQRKAIAVRDKTCCAEGCDQPAKWTEIHHLKPWAQGGGTDLADGIAACPWHHHRLHDDRYEQEWFPDRTVRFRLRR